ncbi:MAG: dephospho-CoA kinase [Deltaproteobacteria bacterium]|nr:dephospho-CoA kinase [Deltaproteobacteria bacterium]
MSPANTKVIGITGGIATGKSTVSRWFKKKGCPVICADSIAHDLLTTGTVSYKKTVRIFTKNILNPDKSINRATLAQMVFTNPKQKQKLEKILHARVRKKMRALLKEYKKKKHRLIFLDIPLLFENRLEWLCDGIICISAPQKTQIERLKNHRGQSRKHALDRIKAQMPLRHKEKKSTFVIKNKGSMAELNNKLKDLFKKISDTSYLTSLNELK